jgi:hypothetical protein
MANKHNTNFTITYPSGRSLWGGAMFDELRPGGEGRCRLDQPLPR